METDNGIELSAAEVAAIKSLERLAKRWPGSLWLYSASGTLWVMRTDDNGMQAHLSGGRSGIDPGYSVTAINIQNDGGDW